MVENVDTLFHSLENFTQKEGVIGKPVTQGEKTFMPVVSVTIGYGGGNASMGAKGQPSASGFTSGSATANSGTGAIGLGAKLNTEAIIVIDDQSKDISMLPMSMSGATKIAEKLPQILSGMTQNKSSNQQSQPAGQ